MSRSTFESSPSTGDSAASHDDIAVSNDSTFSPSSLSPHFGEAHNNETHPLLAIHRSATVSTTSTPSLHASTTASFHAYDAANAQQYNVSKPYGVLTAWSVFINFVIGTGVFGLPHAFYEAGSLLAIMVLLGFAALSIICMIYTLESMSRAEGILLWKDRQTLRTHNYQLLHNHTHTNNHLHADCELTTTTTTAAATTTTPSSSLAARVLPDRQTVSTYSHQYGSFPSSSNGSLPSPPSFSDDATATHHNSISPLCVSQNPDALSLYLSNKPIPHLTYRKVDFIFMSQLYGGWPLTLFTNICLFLYCLGCLWAYVCVFSVSVDTLFFQYVLGEECNVYDHPTFACTFGYYVAVAFFSVVVIYLSLQDLADQAGLQRVLTGYRFSAFITMALTALIASFYPNTFDTAANLVHTSPPFFATVPLINWSGFGMIFGVAGVALNVHYNLPDIIQPLREKQHTLKVCILGMASTILFYTLIGYICAAEFGEKTFSLVTLNWTHYTGLQGGWGEGVVQWWAVVIKLFIMLFPVTNMLSVYPLVALSLGDNLVSAIPPNLLADDHNPHRIKLICRCIATIPPLILALVAGKLDVIFNLTGLVAFFLELVIPCLLSYLSMKYITTTVNQGIYDWTTLQTPFSAGVISKPATVLFVLFISVIAFIYAVYITITAMINGEEVPG